MNKYKYNIIISSLPKSGTVLLSNIIKELTNLEYIQSYLTASEKNTSYGGINKVTENEIFVYKDFYNQDGSFYKHEKVDISNEINLNKKKLIFLGHTAPNDFMKNEILAKIEKKIYIYRYGLDVLNSKMKFIENLDYTLALMKRLKTQEKYQKLRYLSVDKVMETIQNWKYYSQGYIKNKDNFYGIKYEELLKNPNKEIQKLCDYLEISISEKDIKNIIKKVFFKELSKSEFTHKFYKHYNNAQKTKEWMSYLPYSFFEKFEKDNKLILKKLNYKTKQISPYPNNKFHKTFKRKLNLFKERKQPKSFTSLSAKTFIKKINHYLENKKIAIYGYNNYSKSFLDKLNKNIEIVMICDHNYKKINNKNVIAPKKLLNNVSQFDYILIVDTNQEFIQKNIKKVLRLHGGVEIIDAYNLDFKKAYKQC